MQRNVDIEESRRNGPQPSRRRDDDDDDDRNLSRFDTVPACDGRTDGQTYDRPALHSNDALKTVKSYGVIIINIYNSMVTRKPIQR